MVRHAIAAALLALFVLPCARVHAEEPPPDRPGPGRPETGDEPGEEEEPAACEEGPADEEKKPADAEEAGAGERPAGGEEKPADAEEEPEEPEEDADPALLRILEHLDKANRGLRTLQAPYLQRRKVRISRRLRKSRGVFYLEKRPEPAGLRVVFEETEPHRMKLLFTDERVVYLDRDGGKRQTFDPRKGGVRPSEIWVLGRSLRDLRKHYRFERREVDPDDREAYEACLRLRPRSKKLAKWVREMHVWLAVETHLPLRVKIVDPSGEYQEFLFEAKKTRRNAEIPPSVFAVGD